MITKVTLGGYLGRKFGREWRLDLANPSPAEAVRALSVVCKGFKAWLLEHSKPGYHVFARRKSLQAEQLRDPTGSADIHIMPALSGAKSGWLGVILGGVLIAAGIVTAALFSWTGIGAQVGLSIASLGFSLAAGGVATLLTGAPPAAAKETGEVNYTFSGPANTTGIGHAISICYGKLEIGSQVISAGISQRSLVSDGIAYDDPNPSIPGRWHNPRPLNP